MMLVEVFQLVLWMNQLLNYGRYLKWMHLIEKLLVCFLFLGVELSALKSMTETKSLGIQVPLILQNIGFLMMLTIFGLEILCLFISLIFLVIDSYREWSKKREQQKINSEKSIKKVEKSDSMMVYKWVRTSGLQSLESQVKRMIKARHPPNRVRKNKYNKAMIFNKNWRGKK